MTKRELPSNLHVPAIVRAECLVSPDALERFSPINMQDSDHTITILDVIGEDYFGEGVTAKRISAALRRIGDNPVTVVINSPGGSFFEGLAIYNLLRNHPQPVTVEVIGIAASAASFIAMAADTLKIAQAAFLMIHNTQMVGIGDRNDFLDLAETMASFDDVLTGIYAARSGISAGDLAGMLDRETWVSGVEAVESGLADEIFEPGDYAPGDPENHSALQCVRAVDAIMAKQNIPRTKRRELLGGIKGTQDAARTNTHDAVAGSVEGLLASLKTMNEDLGNVQD